MKIRIGYGLGTNSLTNDEDRFGHFVDELERLRFDSLWVSERISGHSPDPVVAMAFCAGRTQKLKFGMSVMVLPGRNPVLVAKQLATLDRLSSGRMRGFSGSACSAVRRPTPLARAANRRAPSPG